MLNDREGIQTKLNIGEREIEIEDYGINYAFVRIFIHI